MQKKDIDFKKIPDAPGVYLFRGARKKLLYVGKATSLRSRVRSYFAKDLDATRGARIVNMLEAAKSLDWQETDSVLEALILEANLIKKHQPEANVREKDNKSFNYVVITKEAFPRVLQVRGRELFGSWNERDIKYVFGPFTSGGALKDALTIIRKIFPFRDTCEPCPAERSTQKKCTPCFNRQIGLCPGVCSGDVTAQDYARTITTIKRIFEDKKHTVIAQLERDMKRLAKEERFEEAALVRTQLHALNHIKETALIGSEYKVSSGEDSGRIEAYDVAHIGETARVGVMVVVEGGTPVKKEYRRFTIKTQKQGDIAALEEILRRRFEHREWQLPALIVLDGGIAQKNAALRVMREYGYAIPLVHVVKNERHKAGRIVGNAALIAKLEKDVILANTEAHRFAVHFHRKKRSML